jgi:hypothetical protein
MSEDAFLVYVTEVPQNLPGGNEENQRNSQDRWDIFSYNKLSPAWMLM